MKRIAKAICIALSLVLLVNIVGFEATASDPGTENPAEGENVESPSPGSADEEGTDDGSGSGDAADVNDEEDTTDTAEPDNNDSQPDEPAGVSVNEEEEILDVQPGQDGTADKTDNELNVQVSGEVSAVPVAGANKLKVTWDAQSNAAGYKVTVKPENGTEAAPISVAETTTEVAVTPGIKYTIKVTYNTNADQDLDQEIGSIPAILLAAPAGLKATPANGTVKLTWSAVAGAASYTVSYGSGLSKSTTAASCDITGLTNAKSYSFSVTAHAKYTESGKEYSYDSTAAAVSATPIGNKPAKVTGLSGIDGEKSAILTWSKATDAASYAIYRYNTSKKKWEVVKTGVTKLTYTDSKLTAGKSYKYRVAGVNENGTGTLSATVTISVKKTPGTTVRSIGYKATVKSRAPLFATKKSSKRLRYLKAGTNVTTIDYGSGRYKIQIGGKNYWISKDRLKFKASIWTTKDYSTKVKEDFVNKKGYKSSSKYLIWISQYTQRVIIYQGSKGKWKMIRNCRCATGTHLHMTPKGIFKVGKKEKGWFYRTTYEKPIVHFQSQNSFHSRIKNYKGGYADATIGRPRSKGCVRLYDEDINFIYKKCPKGTTVVSL